RPVGTFGRAAAFSFYPTKNVGGYGDGGIVTTNDAAIAERVRLLRQYGWGSVRYASDVEGINSRMDEMQAAIVRTKLERIEREDRARRAHAAAYDEGLADLPLQLPPQLPGFRHAYHLYVIRTRRRDELREFLRARGIATAVHYPYAVHQQAPYRHLARAPLLRTEVIVREILSLPLYPDLRESERDRVIDAVR